MSVITTSQGPEFTFNDDALNPFAHVVAVCVATVGDKVTRAKWRCCLSINPDGTWQWAPVPTAVVVPAEITTQIGGAVKSAVLKYGVNKIAPLIEARK